ncbi:putative integral membrane protein [Brugia pahangi]|uniref:Bm11088, isoform b n=1 Tax=Brugia malayi TaxID=6279 RepID=A0A1I9G5C2_BRUMA|nr:Bm11088, isoform b [Brugia malayi]
MRLLVRFALAILICLLLIAAYEYLNIRQRVISRNDPTTDADEVVRILLMSDDPASSWETNVNVTFNVIVVLIISLLSIALLVTG